MRQNFGKLYKDNMIKNIATGAGLQISNTYSNWPTFYNTVSGTGNSLLGQVRYNGSGQNLEVYDGTNWLTMTGTYPTIELTGDVQAVLHWARARMAEEAEWENLASDNATLQDAIDTLRKAQEQVKILAALIKT
jgi:hypothetical protein